ncbi:IMV membrane protein [Eastern grey kangaroopox virus]|uniref:IMV membrane protein n=1 Tax=Eastern grey kangaroopox virus TaxID=2042482 RepID=A0A2C9DT19_9POXV|nr:IMV membrane protein [Eastern grey kangaroopox virus]ATI21152.1 IMV membrane protein [Eastern grey kangaroopox virus]ATX75059.1 IMV membrane protein [Eastern grey kangaroopox virus]
MDRLKTGIFGVFIDSTEDDFEDFINTVMAVLTEAKPKYKINAALPAALLGLLLAALLFLYLKLVP